VKIKICLVSLLVALVMVTLASPRTEAQAIDVSFPDTVGSVGDTLDIPIFVDDLTGKGVLSFGLTVMVDTRVIVPLAALTEGTIASSWGVPTFNVIQDSIKIGIAGAEPLTKGGTLLFIRCAVNPQASVSDTSILQFADFLFNEGIPSNITKDGLFIVKPTGVEDDPSSLLIPSCYSLSQNYPNPFNSATAISYQLPAVSSQRSAVSLKLYNILGQEVRMLVNKEQAPGYYSVVWDGRNSLGREVSSGMYFCRLNVLGDRLKVTKTLKMVLIR